MNTIDEHLVKARHNLAFLSAIDASRGAFSDWAVVVLFYRALHLVSAVIHRMGGDHGNTHRDRNRAVRAVLSPGAAMSYIRLYSRSRALRYEEVRTTTAEFDRLLRSDFEPLLQEVRQYLPEAP
jgi:hypothetical protein